MTVKELVSTPITFKELDLHPEIFKAVEICGYITPTPVQQKAIPAVIEGRDVVASAQTGTGKTAAFVLPALNYLAQHKQQSHKTRILILTPTRELANQVTKAAMQYGKFLRFNIVNLVGGMPYHQQIRELTRGADIIVATPGRLLDHIEQKRVNLSGISMLILDEADRMLDMGFIEDVEYIAKLTPADRQTLLFSATVDKQLTTVVKHLLKNPVRIDMSTDTVTLPQIEQQFYRCTSPHHKLKLLSDLLQDTQVYKAIIFTATKSYADKIADKLRDEGFAASALHGDLRQNVRNRTIDQLKQGKIQFLVATDVAARGIDISDITHVINFDLPRFCEDYVHRIGRTGRAGKSGTAISFVLGSDSKHLQRIERYIGQRVKVLPPTAVVSAAVHVHDAQPSSSEHKPFRSEGKPFRSEGKPFRSEGKPFRSEGKPFRGKSHDDESTERKKPFKRRFDRDDDAPASSDRKPFKRRFDRDGDAPASSDRKPFKRRFDRNEDAFPSTERKKPFKRRFDRDDDAPASSERKPFKRRFDRNEDAFPSTERKKPFKRRFDRDGDASASSDRKPFKRRFDRDGDAPASSDRKPFKRRFDRDGDAPASSDRKPFKRRFDRDGDAPASSERRPSKRRFDRDDDAPREFTSRKPGKKPFKKDGGKKPFHKSGDARQGDKPLRKGKRKFS